MCKLKRKLGVCSEEASSHHWSCLLIHFEKHAWRVVIMWVRKTCRQGNACPEGMKLSRSLEAGDATAHLGSLEAPGLMKRKYMAELLLGFSWEEMGEAT